MAEIVEETKFENPLLFFPRSFQTPMDDNMLVKMQIIVNDIYDKNVSMYEGDCNVRVADDKTMSSILNHHNKIVAHSHLIKMGFRSVENLSNNSSDDSVYMHTRQKAKVTKFIAENTFGYNTYPTGTYTLLEPRSPHPSNLVTELQLQKNKEYEFACGKLIKLVPPTIDEQFLCEPKGLNNFEKQSNTIVFPDERDKESGKIIQKKKDIKKSTKSEFERTQGGGTGVIRTLQSPVAGTSKQINNARNGELERSQGGGTDVIETLQSPVAGTSGLINNARNGEYETSQDGGTGVIGNLLSLVAGTSGQINNGINGEFEIAQGGDTGVIALQSPMVGTNAQINNAINGEFEIAQGGDTGVIVLQRPVAGTSAQTNNAINGEFEIAQGGDTGVIVLQRPVAGTSAQINNAINGEFEIAQGGDTGVIVLQRPVAGTSAQTNNARNDDTFGSYQKSTNTTMSSWKRNMIDSTSDPILDKMRLHISFFSDKRRNRVGPYTYIDKCCTVCTKRFDRKNDLKRHVIQHIVDYTLAKQPVFIDDIMALVCEICWRSPFDSIDAYKAHLRVHADLTLYQCLNCDKGFSDASNFAKHKKVHINNDYFQCDLCARKFRLKNKIIQHMNVHKNTPPQYCKYCGKMFYFESMLKKHYRRSHLKYRLHEFALRASIRLEPSGITNGKHMLRKQIIDCNICKSKFRKYDDLKKHFVAEHGAHVPKANTSNIEDKTRKRFPSRAAVIKTNTEKK